MLKLTAEAAGDIARRDELLSGKFVSQLLMAMGHLLFAARRYVGQVGNLQRVGNPLLVPIAGLRGSGPLSSSQR